MGNAEHLVQAARQAGTETLFLPDAAAAGEWLKEHLCSGDIVLVKGSRGVRLEQAIAALDVASSA